MKRGCPLIVFCLALATLAPAAEDAAGVPSARELLRARLAEQAKAGPDSPAALPPATPITETARAIVEQAAEKNAPAPAKDAAAEKKSDVHKEPATVLPKVQVNRDRVTVLDQELAKEDKAIAREKQNTKPTEVDKALNDSKVAQPLSIFGGESTQFRQQVARQRVSLMEDEKDLLEAIAHAKTKAEKQELQQQLDYLRMERRELERAMR